MQFDDKHREIIQEHYRHPRHKSPLGDEDMGAVLDNPSCGDRVALKLVPGEDGLIREILFDGEGCSISMASASILTEVLAGRTLEEARTIASRVHRIFSGEETTEGLNEYGDLTAFQGLVNYPVRLKCAALAWQTLDLLLERTPS